MFQNKGQSSSQTKYKENAARETESLSSGFHTFLLVELGVMAHWSQAAGSVFKSGLKMISSKYLILSSQSFLMSQVSVF